MSEKRRGMSASMLQNELSKKPVIIIDPKGEYESLKNLYSDESVNKFKNVPKEVEE